MQPHDSTNEPSVKLCECGCGQPAPIAKKNNKRRGHIKGMPLRFINRHNFLRGTLEERLWNKIDKRGPDECWPWRAATDSNGYGHLGVGSRKNGTHRMVKAHRVSYELHYGPIPRGMHILHKCDRPSCTNPAHLFLGTHADNMTDRKNKERQAKGERHGMTKLTNENVRHIRELYETGMLQKDIAAQFYVSQTTISFIVRRESWSHS